MNWRGPVFGTARAVCWVVVVGFFGLLMGCDEPIYHDLDEGQANQMVVALNQQGFAAEKQRDPNDGERWAVVVPGPQRVPAWEALAQQGLPRPGAGGFGEFYPGSGLIPTAQEERVVLQYATAREIQASLLKIQGVVDAHVNLVLPEKPRVQMSNSVVSEPRASVLVQWREREEGPPLSEEEVRYLVSGGVEQLKPESVHVVMLATAAPPPRASAPALDRVGPLKVAPESAGLLKGLVLLMGGIIIALSSLVAYLVLMARRGPGDE